MIALARSSALALILSAVFETAHAQSTLRGSVLTLDSTAITAAHVTLHDSAGQLKAEAVSDSIGGFHFRIAKHTRAISLYISVVRIGYVSIEFVPVRIGVSEDVAVEVHMSPDAVTLAPVTVVARARNRSPTLDDYYDKVEDTRRGWGHALNRDVMKQYAGLELNKALQRVPGVQPSSLTSGGLALAVPRMRGGCIPLTLLDRVPIPPDQLATLDPGDLEGVILYVGNVHLPPEFSPSTPGIDCGLILAYTAAAPRRRSAFSLFNAALIIATFATVVLVQR